MKKRDIVLLALWIALFPGTALAHDPCGWGQMGLGILLGGAFDCLALTMGLVVFGYRKNPPAKRSKIYWQSFWILSALALGAVALTGFFESNGHCTSNYGGVLMVAALMSFPVVLFIAVVLAIIMAISKRRRQHKLDEARENDMNR